MPRTYATDIKLVRTPLDGGGSTTIEDTYDAPRRRVLAGSVHLTQSIGNQAGDFEVDNRGGVFDAWASGDVLAVYVKNPLHHAWRLVLEGYLGEPVEVAGRLPRLQLTVLGSNAVLEKVRLTQDHDFDATTPYTTMFDTLCTTYLTGYTRTITADTSAPTVGVSFGKGANLRAVLDHIRRALVAKTSQKWEYVASKDGATKNIKLFKRDTSVQRTIKFKDVLASPTRHKGNAFDLVNKVQLFGATVASKILDETARTLSARTRLDASTDWTAYPFVPLDTPLSSLTVEADRSTISDPPTLTGVVVRNSDNVNRARHGHNYKLPFYVVDNVAVPSAAKFEDLQKITDGDSATGITFAAADVPNDGAYHDVCIWDIGVEAAAMGVWAIMEHSRAASAGTWDFKIQSSGFLFSDVDGWTQNNVSPVSRVTVLGAKNTDRFWKLQAKRTSGSGSCEVRSVYLLPFKNTANPAPTDAKNVFTEDTEASGSQCRISTTGNASTEILVIDMGAQRSLVKALYKHNESTASAQLNIYVATSTDGSTWTDVAILASTTSVVTDTILFDDGEFRYLRFLVVDERAGGSAAITCRAGNIDLVFQTDEWAEPALGDALDGASVSWDVTSLVAHPAALEERTYAAPRLALGTDRKYWFLQKAGGGAVNSWWDIDYAKAVPTGLVGEWRLDDQSGDYQDSVGANALTTTGAASVLNRTGWGLSRGRLMYVRNGGYATKASPTGLPNGSGAAWSMAIWLSADDLDSANRVAMSFGNDADGQQAQIKVNTTNDLVVGTRGAGNELTAFSLNAYKGTLIRILVTCGTDNEIRCYYNGVLAAGPFTLGTNNVGTDRMRIGATSNAAASQFWIGRLERARIWNVELTADQAAADYAEMDAWQTFDPDKTSPIAPPESLKTTDSGTTWAPVAGYGVILAKLEFNIHELEATEEDLVSQAKYANFVPGGVLYDSFRDDALVTQDMIETEAQFLILTSADVSERVALTVALDPTLEPGRRVTLDPDLLPFLKSSGDVDVLEVTHDFDGGKTMLTINEHTIHTDETQQAKQATTTLARIFSGWRF